MKAGVCLQLSNTTSRDAWRRRGLIEANLLQTVTRGVVAALSKPSRDAWRRCDLIEAILLQTVTRGVVAALSKPDRDAWRRRGLIEANRSILATAARRARATSRTRATAAAASGREARRRIAWTCSRSRRAHCIAAPAAPSSRRRVR
jgi:hypothetical protein